MSESMNLQQLSDMSERNELAPLPLNSDNVPPKRIFVGGMPIIPLSRAEWAEHLISRSIARREHGPSAPPFFTSANGNVISKCARDHALEKAFEKASGIDADGMSLLFASRLLCETPIPERCATTDLFHDVAQRAQDAGVSFYLLGGTEEVNERAVEQARHLYPRLIIAGRHHGYFDTAAEPGICEAINRAAPDILWIGLGVPNEQYFVVRNLNNLGKVGLIKTCGGLFDFLSGKRVRAPRWMQNAGLEWLFRIYLEPRRLFWRYAVTNAHALWVLLTRTEKKSQGATAHRKLFNKA